MPLEKWKRTWLTNKRVKQLDTRKYSYRPTPLRSEKSVTRSGDERK
ncbi:hypothetical protein HanPSC8_Chr17g0761521 [Helianthus annuus]|nr:hypothetical protein HanPSC8_Chr17g0761521 [Helianthus annuus]